MKIILQIAFFFANVAKQHKRNTLKRTAFRVFYQRSRTSEF